MSIKPPCLLSIFQFARQVVSCARGSDQVQAACMRWEKEEIAWLCRSKPRAEVSTVSVGICCMKFKM
jgi:hypothetical protein